jgi:hypothetical protein
MYSERKIALRLDAAAEEFGFRPAPHTVAEVAAFEQFLEDEGLYQRDDQGQIISMAPVGDYEANWIENEKAMCMCDAFYAITRYGFVKNERNVIERFSFRTPQRLMTDLIADLEDRDASIELLFLKARQLGVSTLIELLVGHRIVFSYGVNAVIGSADRVKTYLMANMLFMFYDMMPFWLKPKWSRRVESDQGMLVFGVMSSGVSFQHGAQTSGIARGTTPTIYHLSEVASYKDPVNQIEASLLKAVHASPQVFGALESTGEGDKGWLPDTWRYAKMNWAYNRSRLCPLFLPWFCGTDIYPTPTWLRMRPVPSDWHPNAETRQHVAKAELYVRSHPMLAKHLGSDYRMPVEQKWFWEVEHEQAKAKGMESVFLQEMAGDDEEALQRSTESVFGHDTIVEIETERVKKYSIYGITGQSIEDVHEPDTSDIDYEKERIPVRFQGREGKRYRWDLIPLKFPYGLNESNPDDAIGKLFVFEEPRPNVNYSIGVDTSEGGGGDSTVISVWALGYKGMPDYQVAEFASPYVNHVEAYAFVLAIAAYYGKFMAEEGSTTRWKQPYMSIEQVAAVGDTCQLQMARMGYHNFHRMTRYDDDPKKIMKRKRSTAGKRGWYTFGWSRKILTGNFVHSAQNGWLKINSPWLIGEMKTFEVHVTATGNEKMEHEDGECDDRIFAAGMAVFCPHDMDQLSERSKKRPNVPTALPPLDLGPSAGFTVNPNSLHETVSVDSVDVLFSDVTELERYTR